MKQCLIMDKNFNNVSQEEQVFFIINWNPRIPKSAAMNRLLRCKFGPILAHHVGLCFSSVFFIVRIHWLIYSIGWTSFLDFSWIDWYIWSQVIDMITFCGVIVVVGIGFKWRDNVKILYLIVVNSNIRNF